MGRQLQACGLWAAVTCSSKPPLGADTWQQLPACRQAAAEVRAYSNGHPAGHAPTEAVCMGPACSAGPVCAVPDTRACCVLRQGGRAWDRCAWQQQWCCAVAAALYPCWQAGRAGAQPAAACNPSKQVLVVPQPQSWRAHTHSRSPNPPTRGALCCSTGRAAGLVASPECGRFRRCPQEILRLGPP